LSAFGDPEHFKLQVDALVRDLRNSEKLPGVERIWIPGEQSHDKRERYQRDGIPLAPALVADLNALAVELGIASLPHGELA
jgi:LDH2 family malate/lactate/ureidoglycolate dehydrogenase